MTEEEQFSAERVADRLEIQHRIYQFCRAVDRLDLESARSAFHPEGYDNHGAYKGGVDGLFEWVTGRHATLPYSLHHVGNVFIEFSGPDEAFAESYVLAWQSVSPEANLTSRPSPDKFEILTTARYVDRFTRREGRWRILERVAVTERAMVVPEGEDGPISFPAEWTAFARDETDPAQQLRIRLGLQSPG